MKRIVLLSRQEVCDVLLRLAAEKLDVELVPGETSADFMWAMRKGGGVEQVRIELEVPE